MNALVFASFLLAVVGNTKAIDTEKKSFIAAAADMTDLCRKIETDTFDGPEKKKKTAARYLRDKCVRRLKTLRDCGGVPDHLREQTQKVLEDLLGGTSILESFSAWTAVVNELVAQDWQALLPAAAECPVVELPEFEVEKENSADNEMMHDGGDGVVRRVYVLTVTGDVDSKGRVLDGRLVRDEVVSASEDGKPADAIFPAGWPDCDDNPWYADDQKEGFVACPDAMSVPRRAPPGLPCPLISPQNLQRQSSLHTALSSYTHQLAVQKACRAAPSLFYGTLAKQCCMRSGCECRLDRDKWELLFQKLATIKVVSGSSDKFLVVNEPILENFLEELIKDFFVMVKSAEQAEKNFDFEALWVNLLKVKYGSSFLLAKRNREELLERLHQLACVFDLDHALLRIDTCDQLEETSLPEIPVEATQARACFRECGRRQCTSACCGALAVGAVVCAAHLLAVLLSQLSVRDI